VSSILRTKLLLFFLAHSQANKAVLAPPICKKPVGEGANLDFIYDSFSKKIENLF
jgi:hypothetical protein